MSPSPPVTEVQVEEHVFSPTLKPPGSAKTLFLGGAGVREIEEVGKFITVTAIGVYLEDDAIPSLAVKWKGKSADELKDSLEFFMDVVTGSFEKFTQVTMILPLTGKEYSEKVAENCVKNWKEVGIYTDAEEKAIEKFQEAFKDRNFTPGTSILFTQSSLGSLTISFSKDCSMPAVGNVVIDNKNLSESILESVIGKEGVSPDAKHNLAVRISDLVKQLDDEAVGNGKVESRS